MSSANSEGNPQPQFKLDIRNAPIQEEDDDADAATANLVNTLRAVCCAQFQSIHVLTRYSKLHSRSVRVRYVDGEMFVTRYSCQTPQCQISKALEKCLRFQLMILAQLLALDPQRSLRLYLLCLSNLFLPPSSRRIAHCCQKTMRRQIHSLSDRADR